METNNTQNEEVDLSKVFAMIGNAFKNLFNSILNLFKSIFHYLILGLIFIKNHALKLAIATVLGGVLGYVLEMNKAPEYSSNMLVEINFKSGKHLYNQQDYLNTLVSNKDSEKLAKIFSISKKDASNLTGFIVSPYDFEKNLFVEFDSYMKRTDTVLTRGFTIKDFEKRINNTDYRVQKITAYSKDRTIFNKLKNGFINLMENDHFKGLLKLKSLELANRKEVLENNLKEIDSLREIYKEVALLNAKKTGTLGTNIDLSESTKKRNFDMDLFSQSNQILNLLKKLDNEKIGNEFIISVLSNFTLGVENNSLLHKKWLRFAFFGGVLMFLFIIGMNLNKFLNNYQK
jgi:hypothetical protein